MDENVSRIESLCLDCKKNGETLLYPTDVPGFGSTVIASFECKECGYTNREVMQTGEIYDFGVTITCLVKNKEDLNRLVLRGEKSSIKIKELDLEIEPGRALITTIEGVFVEISENLKKLNGNIEQNKKIKEIIDGIDECLLNKKPLKLVLNDPTGKSHIGSYIVGKTDPFLKIKKYFRTEKEAEEIGLIETNREIEGCHNFVSYCPSCTSECETRMSVITIPHFKEIIIMATICDKCGFKNNEIKPGGAISEKGLRISLSLKKEDLMRDVLKSETCSVFIPEIDLELSIGSGFLGGRLTTVEGLLLSIKEELESKSIFFKGDSTEKDRKNCFENLVFSLGEIAKGEKECTLILDDPMANSHISNIYAPEHDPRIEIVSYERTNDQNEEFGLNDIMVDI